MGEVVSINGGAIAEVAPEAAPEAAATPVKRTKIAIVGFADSWPKAPYHHPDWVIFTLNQFYDLCGAKEGLAGGTVDFHKLASEQRLWWCDLHSRHDLETDVNVIKRHPHHLQRLKELGALGVPIFMQQHHEDIPNSIEYPLAAMKERFGDYWTNSVSYMMALAIAEGATDIGLYGVNMAQDSEYQSQRPSCEYMIGFARGAGITVHLPPESDLLSAPFLYAFEDHKVSKVLAKIDQMTAEHQARMAHHDKVRDENNDRAHEFSGALQATALFKRMLNQGTLE